MRKGQEARERADAALADVDAALRGAEDIRLRHAVDRLMESAAAVCYPVGPFNQVSIHEDDLPEGETIASWMDSVQFNAHGRRNCATPCVEDRPDWGVGAYDTCAEPGPVEATKDELWVDGAVTRRSDEFEFSDANTYIRAYWPSRHGGKALIHPTPNNSDVLDDPPDGVEPAYEIERACLVDEAEYIEPLAVQELGVVHADAFSWDEARGEWQRLGTVVDGQSLVMRSNHAAREVVIDNLTQVQADMIGRLAGRIAEVTVQLGLVSAEVVDALCGFGETMDDARTEEESDGCRD